MFSFINLNTPAIAATTFGAALNLVAQNVPVGGTDIQSLITQLGIFGVVVAVFKFMLGRQDSRDAEQEKRDKETLDILRKELADERAFRADDRRQFSADLEKERQRHDATRQILYEKLSSQSPRVPNESSGQRMSRLQREIDRATTIADD